MITMKENDVVISPGFIQLEGKKKKIVFDTISYKLTVTVVVRNGKGERTESKLKPLIIGSQRNETGRNGKKRYVSVRATVLVDNRVVAFLDVFPHLN